LFALSAIVLLVALATFAARRLGRLFVHVDPLRKSDAIIILGSQRMERTLEAGQLYREGWAPRVVVLRVRDLNRRGVLTRLGINLPLFFDNQVSALVQMGVPPGAILEAREVIESTEGEARQIAEFAAARRYSRVIVVTSAYHTLRASWYLRKLAPNVEVVVRATRFDGADPEHWWQWPMDRIDVLSETIKWPKAFMRTLGRRS